jgi:hypothetical protein
MRDAGIRSLAIDLWVVERPFKIPVVRADIGTRMTIARLRDGGLFLHSPVRLDEGLRHRLNELGEVQAIVAPSRVHHLFVGDYVSAYPGVQTFAAPGLPEKRKDIKFGEVLGDDAPQLWCADLDQHVFKGAPVMNEVVFFHRATRTVIFTDLVFNLPASSRRSAPIFFWILDAPGKFGPHRLMRTRGIRDRAAARQSVERILRWDFDRVIMSHGDVVERGGKECVAAAFVYL